MQMSHHTRAIVSQVLRSALILHVLIIPAENRQFLYDSLTKYDYILSVINSTLN